MSVCYSCSWFVMTCMGCTQVYARLLYNWQQEKTQPSPDAQ